MLSILMGVNITLKKYKFFHCFQVKRLLNGQGQSPLVWQMKSEIGL